MEELSHTLRFEFSNAGLFVTTEDPNRIYAQLTSTTRDGVWQIAVCQRYYDEQGVLVEGEIHGLQLCGRLPYLVRWMNNNLR